MSVIKDMVNSPHPIWRRYSAYWDFLLMSYEGGVDYSNARVLNSAQQNGGNIFGNLFRVFVNGQQQDTKTIYGNLFMHPKELTEDYNRRVAMSYYYNFCAPIIDIYGDHLFKQAVLTDFGSIKSDVDAVKDNIDMQGSSVEEFRKAMSDMAQLYGHCFVLVDSPSVSLTGEVTTRQDQIEKRAFPYFSLIPPQRVKNWALDEFGKPYWVLIEEEGDVNKEYENFRKDADGECYYRLWTRDGWVLYNDDYEVEDEGVHDLGEVPIVCVFDKKSMKAKNFLGISQIADIAFIARDIYNASSELRQILRDQTFAFLAMQGTSDEYGQLDLGTGKGLLYPENRNAPQYVSPPADNARTYFDHIDRQISKIYSIAKIDAGGVGGQAKASPSTDTQSGVSKAWDFNQTNSSLSSKSSNLEDAEQKLWALFAAWQGKEFDGSVQYPNEFSISSLMDDLNELEIEARLNLGKTFETEVKKAIQKKKFPRMGEKELEQMAQEVESISDANQTKASSPGFVSLADRINAFKNNTATGGNNTGGTK